jgi:hypothetical protein
MSLAVRAIKKQLSGMYWAMPANTEVIDEMLYVRLTAFTAYRE